MSLMCTSLKAKSHTHLLRCMPLYPHLKRALAYAIWQIRMWSPRHKFGQEKLPTSIPKLLEEIWGKLIGVELVEMLLVGGLFLRQLLSKCAALPCLIALHCHKLLASAFHRIGELAVVMTSDSIVETFLHPLLALLFCNLHTLFP